MMQNGVLERKQFHVAWGKYYRTREVEPYIRSLENQFEGSERRNQKLQDELTILRDTVSSRDAEIARLTRETGETGARLQAVREEADRALSEAKSENAHLHRVRENLAARESELESLRREEESRTKEAYASRDEARKRAEEADAQLSEMKARLSAAEQRAVEAEERLGEMKSRLAEAEDRLKEQPQKSGQANAGSDAGKESFYREENRILREQLSQLRAAAASGSAVDTDTEELRLNLDRANDRNRVLKSQVEQLESELREYESMMTDQSLRDAQKRAQKIVQDALDQSSKIIDDAENIRARAFAATKAAYFNALMFRQQLAEQFSTIEQNLDNSLGILRSSDMLALSPRQGMEETARTVYGTAETKEWE